VESRDPFGAWYQLRRDSVYEDSKLLVLNKPVGIAVMGDRHDPSLVDIASSAGEQLEWVHRIDKVTSGVVLLAKTHEAHGLLTRQFVKRTVEKRYLAWVTGEGVPLVGEIDLPLMQGRKGRVRVAGNRSDIRYCASSGRWMLDRSSVRNEKSTYDSLTKFELITSHRGASLLLVTPVTGRMHQIRVHLAWIGFPILGDALFSKVTNGRTYLHSWIVAADCPWLTEDSRRQFIGDPGEQFLRGAAADVLGRDSIRSV
jgi:tRNA pseudouridine32 synthase/23S rRNA pseudouridine746 synthase/23S rRNA pseudouridine1911/1915/1917 synthase